MRCAFLSLAFLLAAAAPGAAQAGQAEFEAGLRDVVALMDQGAWARARKGLLALVDAHPEQDYVRLKLPEIEENLWRCSFWEGRKAPALRELISGRLESFDPATGMIRIQYGAGQLRDFEQDLVGRRDVVYRHPITFTGPYSVEIRGRSYPGMPLGREETLMNGGSPTVFVGIREREHYSVIFGFPETNDGRYRRWVPATLSLGREGALQDLDQEQPTPVQPGRPYTLKVTVSARDVKAFYNRKPVLEAKKPSSVYGRLGFTNFDGAQLESVEIRGRSNSSWTRGLVDAAMQDEMQRYKERFRPADHLPAWLYDESRAAAREPAAAKWTFPVKLQPDQLARVQPVLDARTAGDLAGALLRLDRTRADAFPVELRDFLRTDLLVALERHAEAAPHARRLLAALPQFVEGVRLQARILAATGSREEGIVLLRAAAEERPADGALHADLVLLLLEAGRPEQARDSLEKARSLGVVGAELVALNEQLVHALRGPNWRKKFDHETAHYTVVTNIDRKTALEAGQALESAYKGYSLHLAEVPGLAERKFPVYIFSGEAGYRTYARGALNEARENSAGLYSPVLKQLLIWNLPFRDQMFATVRHEGFHQYLDRLVERPPVWFNEGLAEYFETARFDSTGRWREGEPLRHRLLYLKDRNYKLLPMEGFLRAEPGTFYGLRRDLHYAQAWALVHYLRTRSASEKAVFDALFHSLLAGAPAEEAVARAFAGVDLRRLESQLAAHLRRLE